MERSHDLEKDQPIWGTREDLLLASAVGRHGRRSWDSVAVEIKHRIPSGDLINAEVCQQRYCVLERRRFTSSGDEDGVQKADGEGISTETEIYEELKNLWMDELRRDVQRREVTIASLKLKVKKLTEERERNLRESAAGEGSPDLKPAAAENGEPPGIVNGDRVPGENSGHSCKESNSTDPIKDAEKKPGESVKGAAVASGGAREEKSVGDGSYYGSSETIAKAAARPPEIVESGDSVAESKGALENSDVQSSASLSRRRRGRRGKAVSVPNGGVERGADPVAEESRPLLAFLEAVRSDGCGSVFERRLQSQEGMSYRGLIRRHVDLEIVRSKMRGGGAYTMTELFRDLLVLCNNAIVYYPKGSHEYISAVHLRQLVSKDIPATVLKSIPPPVKESTPELESSKPVPLVPLIACRKRSSIAIAAKKDGREEDSVGLEEKTKERGARAITGTRGPRTNKSRGGGRSRNPKADPKLDEVMSENTTDPVVAKNEKKVAGGVAKKRSMANFLNRINRGSPKGSSLLETLKKSSNSTSGGEEKKIAGRRRDGRKGGVASVKAAEAEKSATVKKGRPPKRGAPPTLRKASKRAREEKIPPPSSRKRGRR